MAAVDDDGRIVRRHDVVRERLRADAVALLSKLIV